MTITDPVQGCILVDSIDIEEGIKISAEFNLKGRCNDQDSVDVITNLWGTPPYTSVWSNGDVGPKCILNLPPPIISYMF